MELPDNSLNTGKGRDFQQLAGGVLGAHFGVDFLLDAPLLIGDPPKRHRFDLVSADEAFVGECKNYSWTQSGNVPSAKMGFLNEALLYLSYLSETTLKFVVVRKDIHSRRTESVGEYYHRTNRHRLRGVHVFEIDTAERLVHEIGILPEVST